MKNDNNWSHIDSLIDIQWIVNLPNGDLLKLYIQFNMIAIGVSKKHKYQHIY